MSLRPYDCPPTPINDEMLERLLAAEVVEFHVWFTNKLVLRRMHIRGDSVKVRDEVVLEVADA
jgi:hypothetical protein